MARTKKKVTEEVTPIEEVVETTEEEVEPDKVSEVMDHEIEETKKEEEEAKAEEEKMEPALTEAKEACIRGYNIDIFYNPLITSVEYNTVTKALDKAWTVYNSYDLRIWIYSDILKNMWIKWNFAVCLYTDTAREVVTQPKTALKVLRENGKI